MVWYRVPGLSQLLQALHFYGICTYIYVQSLAEKLTKF